MKRPTIHDVAREAGVSKSTVSLVLQDSPQTKAATRDAVRAAMARLGYVYNRTAASLRQQKPGLIGLVINDLRNPFFAEFAASAQMAWAARGFATVLANTDEDAGLQAQVVAGMIGHGVSAIVIAPASGEGSGGFDVLQRAGIPVLQVLRRGPESGFPFAAPDYAHGSRLAALHLAMAGARAIAFVGGIAGHSVTEERMRGYREVMEEMHRLPVVLPGRPGRGFGRAAAGVLAREHPDIDAVICFNDLVALGLVSGLAGRGRKAGPRFRVVGFDGIEEAEQNFPQLSTVDCDVGGFGRQVAGMVLDWLEQGKAPPPETRSPVRLVARASSEG
jgi:LacI family transcriptional regulator